MGDVIDVEIEVPPGTKRPRSRWIRRGVWAGVVLVAYALVGFLLLPVIIKSQLFKRLPVHTKRHATIDEVKVNPFSLSLTIRGLTLTEPNGDLFAGFSELYVNFELASIFKGAWTFQEVTIQKPVGQVTMIAAGKFNFSNLIDDQPKPATPVKELPAVLVEHFAIEGGVVSLADLTRPAPFKLRVSPITVRLNQLTTRRDAGSPYSFTASDDAGQTFAWSGNVSVNPPSSRGVFKVGQINLQKFAPYVADFFQGEIVNGRVDVAADYQFGLLAAGGIDLSVTNAAAKLSNLQIRLPGTEEMLITVPIVAVEGAGADLAQHAAWVKTVRATSGSILARRNKDGAINLLSLLKPQPAKPAATNAPVWGVTLGELAVENYTITVEDKVPAKAATMKLDQLALNVKGFTTATNVPVNVTLALRVNEAGAVKVGATVNLTPLSADAEVAVTDLDLRPFQTYVDEQVKLTLKGGKFSTEGKVHFALSDTGAPLVKFTGKVGLNEFATVDGVAFKEFVKWDMLAVSGIDFNLTPQSVSVAEVKMSGLKTSVIMGADKRSNIEAILNLKPATTNAAPASAATNVMVATQPAAATKVLPVQLTAFILENASFSFSDQSIEPNCNFSVQEFGAKINGLSTIEQQPADLTVSGRVDELAPFSVTGKLKPQMNDLLVDLVISNRNTDLTAFTPYMGKYAGYPLQKGKLTLALRYEIHGKELKATHNVLVDQLTLGARNNSPDATKMPVKLAVALLKDRHGKIEINLPVSGRLDDPKFRVFPLVVQVFVNLISKAVTSPFALLGKLVGGGEELSMVAFEPGSADINAAEGEKLEKLARALDERPGLSLEIAGSVNLEKDRQAMIHQKFERLLKTVRAKEMSAAGTTPPALEEIRLEDAERQRVLKLAYVEAFGPLPTNQPAGTATAPLATTEKPVAVEKPAVVAVEAVKPMVTTPAAGTNRAAVAATPKRAAKAGTAVLKGGQLMALGGGAKAPQPPVAETAKNAPIIDTAKVSAASREVVVAPSASAVPNAANPPSTIVAGASVPEITAPEMEAKLLERVRVTDDELRELIQQRAQKVQARLLKNGKVAAERLFLLAPRTIDANYRGDTKVEMLLN